MKARTTTRLASFAAGAGAIGVAAVLTRACPGSCGPCSTCATALVPMATAATAVAGAMVGSAAVTARGRRGSASRRRRADDHRGPLCSLDGDSPAE